MAGYSGTPLLKKIGIKERQKIVASRAPESFFRELGKLPDGTEVLARAKPPVDVAVAFVKSRADLNQQFSRLAPVLGADGMLWVAWPKKSSGVSTDLNENVIRDIGLPLGLVDIKVCAIDEIWSGLKFVIRKEKRRKREAGGVMG
ncbi:MAG TPA: DUF3052 domain-containing protein [Terriglobales bacterium]|nr:DUF3052 domain-containing protein [Terriglobales bacterium]